jgi:predicted aspartyl protease
MKTRLSCGFSGPGATDFLIEHGPTIFVDIGFDPAWRVGLIPTAKKQNVPALVDTGALESFIDCDLAAELNLPISNRREISGTQGRHEVDVYMAQVYVPTFEFTVYGQFAGVYLLRGGTNFRMLMGRTFLKHFILHYDGPTGRVTLTIGAASARVSS